MDLALWRVVFTDSVALMGITCLPVALDLLEVKIGKILDAGVKIAAVILLAQSGNPFCKL